MNCNDYSNMNSSQIEQKDTDQVIYAGEMLHGAGTLTNIENKIRVRGDPGIMKYGKSQFEKLGRHRGICVRYRIRLLARIKKIFLQANPVKGKVKT